MGFTKTGPEFLGRRTRTELLLGVSLLLSLLALTACLLALGLAFAPGDCIDCVSESRAYSGFALLPIDP